MGTVWGQCVLARCHDYLTRGGSILNGTRQILVREQGSRLARRHRVLQRDSTVADSPIGQSEVKGSRVQDKLPPRAGAALAGARQRAVVAAAESGDGLQALFVARFGSPGTGGPALPPKRLP
jgi:hypothetical protein